MFCYQLHTSSLLLTIFGISSLFLWVLVVFKTLSYSFGRCYHHQAMQVFPYLFVCLLFYGAFGNKSGLLVFPQYSIQKFDDHLFNPDNEILLNFIMFAVSSNFQIAGISTEVRDGILKERLFLSNKFMRELRALTRGTFFAGNYLHFLFECLINASLSKIEYE